MANDEMKDEEKGREVQPVNEMTRPDHLSLFNLIHMIRNQRVMLDEDLAKLYGVQTKALNQAVKRNPSRFPNDFMFQLTKEEYSVLKSQSVTAKSRHPQRSQNVTIDNKRGQHRKYLPYAFTEHGIAMLSSVLKSERAVQVNIHIIRTFVRLRQTLTSQACLVHELKKLRDRVDVHDESIGIVMDLLNRMLIQPANPKKRIGFLGQKQGPE